MYQCEAVRISQLSIGFELQLFIWFELPNQGITQWTIVLTTFHEEFMLERARLATCFVATAFILPFVIGVRSGGIW